MSASVASASRAPAPYETGLRGFLNRLCVLTSVDRDELVSAGVLGPNDLQGWASFAMDPYNWFRRADDETQQRIWTLVERRARG